jgi:hypothetical protein
MFSNTQQLWEVHNGLGIEELLVKYRKCIKELIGVAVERQILRDVGVVPW